MDKSSQELFVQFFDKILPRYRPQPEKVLQRLTPRDLKLLNFRYIFDVSGMTEISHTIEDLVMATPATAIMHTCFQYLSRLEDQLERYQRLSQACQQLWLYGIIDAQIPNWPKTTAIDIKMEQSYPNFGLLLPTDQGFMPALSPEKLPHTELIFRHPEFMRVSTRLRKILPII